MRRVTESDYSLFVCDNKVGLRFHPEGQELIESFIVDDDSTRFQWSSDILEECRQKASFFKWQFISSERVTGIFRCDYQKFTLQVGATAFRDADDVNFPYTCSYNAFLSHQDLGTGSYTIPHARTIEMTFSSPTKKEEVYLTDW